MSISKCMSIVQDLRDEDAEALLEKIDTYQAAGRSPEDAARAAVKDMLSEHATERQGVLKQIKEALPKGFKAGPSSPGAAPVRGQQAAAAEATPTQGRLPLTGARSTKRAEQPAQPDIPAAPIPRARTPGEQVWVDYPPRAPGEAIGEPVQQEMFPTDPYRRDTVQEPMAPTATRKRPAAMPSDARVTKNGKRSVVTAVRQQAHSQIAQLFRQHPEQVASPVEIEARKRNLMAVLDKTSVSLAMNPHSAPYTRGELLNQIDRYHQAVLEADEIFVSDKMVRFATMATNPNVPDDVASALLRALSPVSDRVIDAAEQITKQVVGEHIPTLFDDSLWVDGALSSAGANFVLNQPGAMETLGVSAIAHALVKDPNKEFIRTTYHEAMHAVVAGMVHEYGVDSTQVAKLYEAVNQPHITEQVKKLSTPLTWEYYSKNPEEMLVQAFAHWSMGELSLKADPKLETFFGKVKAMLKAIFNALAGDELLAEVFGAALRGDMQRNFRMTPDEFSASAKERIKGGGFGAEYGGLEGISQRAVRQARAAPEVAAEGPKERSGTDKASLHTGKGALDLTSQNGREQARREIVKIAGKSLKIHIPKSPGLGSNKYNWLDHVVTLAAVKDADMGNAYHEALHAVFKGISSMDKRELYRALNTVHVKHQLQTLLKDSSGAYEHAVGDQEELAAYAFQFWKQGKLKLRPAAEGWFQKLQNWLEDARAWLTNQPGADKIFERIADGYYRDDGDNISPVERETLQDSRGAVKKIINAAAQGMMKAQDTLFSVYDDRLRNTGVGELITLAKKLYTQVGEETDARGLAQDIPIMTAKWMNDFSRVIGADANVAQQTLDAMANGDESSEHAKDIRRFLNRIYNYMIDAGVDVGYMEKYLPMQWSGDLIGQQEAEFIDMMRKYQPQLDALNKELKREGERRLTPESVYQVMSQRNLKDAIPTGDLYDFNGTPTAHHVQERVFRFLTNEDRAPFTEPNRMGSIGQYIKQAVKVAEWSRRFGADSSGWNTLVEQARRRGATDKDIALANDFKDAIYGVKYNQMDPDIRKFFSGVQTYQNLRVLWLSAFASAADPMGIAVRSQDMKEALNAFAYGLRHLWKKPKGELAELAAEIGTINELGTMDSLMTLYGGFEVEGNFKRANDLLFKWNGLDGLTRSLRVYAVGAGLRFIQKADERGLKELGLEKGDLHYMPDGTLAVRGTQFRELGMSPEVATEAARRMQAALNRFVDESVLRPNVAERPAWASNPWFSLLFHLKQFVFSFMKITRKKILHEMEHNPNSLTPVLTGLPYVPLMMASAYIKDLIQFAGEIPANRSAMHYLIQGIERSGFMGTQALTTDVTQNLLAGRNPNRRTSHRPRTGAADRSDGIPQ